MTRRTARATTGVVAVAALLAGLGACRAGDDDTETVGSRADATTDAATGEGVDATDLVTAGLPTDDDLASLVVGGEGPATPAEAGCDAPGTLLDGGPSAEVVEAGEPRRLEGRDGGVRYSVTVEPTVAVYPDATAAAEALAAVEDTAAWDTCVATAAVGNEVGATAVDVEPDDGRATVDADIVTGAGDDTSYLAGVRLARAGRTLVVVEFAAGGQVLDDFGDGGPVDDLVDDLAGRVAALG